MKAAYNLTTGEILACEKGNHLKRCVAIVSRNNHRDGVVNAVMAKANRIGRQRMGRYGDPV